MTTLYFHSIDKDAKVRGTERHHFDDICCNIMWAVLSTTAKEYSDQPSILRNIFPETHYARTARDFADAAKLSLRVGGDNLILGDQKVSWFPLVLNTAYRLGSDPVKLAARLHGQCELHAYIEGKNREWVAQIIEQGRSFKFYRDNSGWENVILLLREDDKTPVVTSFSVCDQFPNAHTANFDYPIDEETGEKDWDAWHEVPYEQQWEMAMQGLRTHHNGLEIKPEDWSDFYFSGGLDANQLLSKLYELYR